MAAAHQVQPGHIVGPTRELDGRYLTLTRLRLGNAAHLGQDYSWSHSYIWLCNLCAIQLVQFLVILNSLQAKT
jgi:hypothetical protein